MIFKEFKIYTSTYDIVSNRVKTRELCLKVPFYKKDEVEIKPLNTDTILSTELLTREFYEVKK